MKGEKKQTPEDEEDAGVPLDDRGSPKDSGESAPEGEDVESERAEETDEPVDPWTRETTTHFRRWYGMKDDQFLAREIGCDVAELRAKALEIFQTPVRRGAWSREDVDSLRALLGALDEKMIGRMIGRTPRAIRAKVVELALELQGDPLSANERVRFKRLYGTRADEDLAIVFGRKVEVVEQEARTMCLSKDKAFLKRKAGGAASTKMPRWTAEELDLLEKMYPTSSNLDIAQALGRSAKSVVSKAHNLRLKKDEARLREMGRENVQVRYERPGDGPARSE